MTHFTSFDGTRIVYLDEGAGPAVLLLHGYMCPARTNFGAWSEMEATHGRAMQVALQTQVKFLKPTLSPETAVGVMGRLLNSGARVIAPDQRGHGDSDKPRDPKAYGGGAMARDAITLLDRLGLGSVDVIGYSSGSVTALRLLALGDPRIRSAVLAGVGPSLPVKGAIMPDCEDWGDALPPEFAAKPVTWKTWVEYAAAVMLGKQPPMGVAGFQAKLADALGFDRVVAAGLVGSLGDGIDAAELKKVKVPVLVLNGDEDAQKREERGFSDLLPNADVRYGTAQGDHSGAPWDAGFQREVIEFLRWRWTAAP